MSRWSRLFFITVLSIWIAARGAGVFAQTQRINFDEIPGAGLRAVDAEQYTATGLRLGTHGAGLFIFGPSPSAVSQPNFLLASQTSPAGNADASIILQFVSPLDGSPATTNELTFSIADAPGDTTGPWTVRAYDINNNSIGMSTSTTASGIRVSGFEFSRIVFEPSADFDGIDNLVFRNVWNTKYVPLGHAWRWHHPTTGVDPATTDSDFHSTWFKNDGSYNGPAFSGPSPSPLGYGTIDLKAIATPIGTPASGLRHSAYFTTTFNVADASQVATLEADILADDGAFIYLNGVLVARHNMLPTVTDTYRQTADGVDVDGVNTETRFFTVRLDPAALRTGENFLAVSLHNDSTGSTDLGFEMNLTAILHAVVPEPTSGGLAMLGVAATWLLAVRRKRSLNTAGRANRGTCRGRQWRATVDRDHRTARRFDAWFGFGRAGAV